MKTGEEVWKLLEKEQKIETEKNEEHTPIKEKQAKWLTEKSSKFCKGEALDIGFGCGFSSIAMALGGDLNVTAVTTDGQSLQRYQRAAARSQKNCPETITLHPSISSDIFLPEKVKENIKYNIIFVDGGHRFDDVFIDCHYAARLVEAGGLLVLDDTHFGAIRSVANWLNTNMSHIWDPFEIIENTVSWKRTEKNDQDSGAEHRHNSGALLPFTVTTEDCWKFQNDPKLDCPLNGNHSFA